MALLVKARGACVFAPLGDVAEVKVPQVDQRVGQLDEGHAIALNFYTSRTDQ